MASQSNKTVVDDSRSWTRPAHRQRDNVSLAEDRTSHAEIDNNGCSRSTS